MRVIILTAIIMIAVLTMAGCAFEKLRNDFSVERGSIHPKGELAPFPSAVP